MISEWPTCPLSEVADDITVGYVGPMVDEYANDGIPFLRSLNVEPFKIHIENVKYISKAFHQKISKSSLKPGDVVIVRTGKPGACAVIPDWLKDANCSDLVIIRPGPNLDPIFLMYYVNSTASHHVNSHTVGAVQQHFNVASARQILLKLPPLPTQHTIARILGSLDDKIELNRQMNETLEEMARAIFQSWFVDFDPVRTKAAGCDTGLPPEVAALFPSEIVEVDGREVPRGWGIATLGDYIEVVKGLSYKGEGLCDDGIPMHNLNSVLEGGGYKYLGIKHYNGEYQDRHIIKPGDIIVTNTEQGFDFLLIGFPAIVPKSFGEWGLFTHHIFRVRPSPQSPLTNHFIYYLLMTPSVREQVIGCTNGTTVNMMYIDGLITPQFVLPSEKVIQAFEKIVSPIFVLLENNEQQSRTLTQIRDALLPKLMSGEISLE